MPPKNIKLLTQLVLHISRTMSDQRDHEQTSGVACCAVCCSCRWRLCGRLWRRRGATQGCKRPSASACRRHLWWRKHHPRYIWGGGESVTRRYSRHTSLALPARLAAAECAWCRACCSQLVCSIVSGPVMGCWYSRERPTCCSCLLLLTSDWYEQQQPPSRLVASSILH
jgi:hypothetical protein